MLFITTEEVDGILEICAKAGLCCEVRGDPGVGKSSLIRQFAEKHNLFYIDKRATQLEPPQINGLEYLDHENRKTVTYTPDWIPLKDDPIPEGYEGFLLNWEERPDADECVKKALYQIMLERTVNGKELHPNVVMTSTGNMLDTNCYAEEDSDAIKTRKVDVYVRSNKDAFLNHCYLQNIDKRITSYLNFRPKNINNYREMEAGADKYACERGWFALDKVIKTSELDLDSTAGLAVASGIISEPTARDFKSFLNCFQYLPSDEQLYKDPLNTPIPNEAGTRYALTGNVAYAIDQEFRDPQSNSLEVTDWIEKLMEFVDRLPMPFQVVTVMDCTKRNPKTLDHPALDRWLIKNGRKIPKAA